MVLRPMPDSTFPESEEFRLKPRLPARRRLAVELSREGALHRWCRCSEAGVQGDRGTQSRSTCRSSARGAAAWRFRCSRQ